MDVIEQALAETARCLVAVVVQIHRNGLVLLRFVDRDLVIRGPRFLARMDQNAQLHIVGSVKTLELLVQGSRIGHRPRFQRHTAGHIFFPGMLQPLQGHRPGFALQHLYLHHTPVDTLGRQICLADHISFVVVQVVDRPGNGIQVCQ